MNLKEIIAYWIKSHGYDGLFHADTCCGCGIDDLMTCGEPSPNCEPGYQGEGCSCDGDCIVGIWRDKPPPLTVPLAPVMKGKFRGIDK